LDFFCLGAHSDTLERKKVNFDEKIFQKGEVSYNFGIETRKRGQPDFFWKMSSQLPALRTIFD